MKVLFVPGGNNFFFSLSYPGESESWWVIQVLMHPSHFFLPFAKTKNFDVELINDLETKLIQVEHRNLFSPFLMYIFMHSFFCHTKYIYLRPARNKGACGTSHLKITFLKTNGTLNFYNLVGLSSRVAFDLLSPYSYILLSEDKSRLILIPNLLKRRVRGRVLSHNRVT